MALNLTNNILEQDCLNDEQYSQHFPTVKLRFSPSITILIYFIYLLPFCFGVFGNISVCLIFFQQKKLRSITNTFLMNLCLNDLIVLCVSIPMTLSAALIEHWIFGKFLCKLVNFTPTLTALVSTFTVAVIAVERWFFIVNKKKFDRRCTLLTLISLWIVSILIALPEFISRQIEELEAPPIPYPMTIVHKDGNNQTITTTIQIMKPACNTNKKIHFCILNPGLFMRIFSYIVITVQYLVPFLFVSVSCYSISRFLKGRMKQMRTYQVHRPTNNNEHNGNQSKKLKKNKHLTFDNVTENEVSSYEEVPVSIISNEPKSTHFFTRFRNSFQNRDRYQESVVTEQPTFRSSSVVGTVLMPTVKSQTHSERRFHRSKKLLICVAALFIISWLPLTIVQIYLEHNDLKHDETIKPNFVYAFLLIPCYLISSISAWMNPVIYNYINRSFRREFYALYPCCCDVASTSTTSSTRSETGSVVERKSLRNMKENASVFSPGTMSTSGPRFVTFADGEKKGERSLVMINEHI